VLLVQKLERRNDLSRLIANRQAKHVAGAVAGALIGFLVEARIGVAVGDVDDLAGLGHVAGYTFS
jgi:hypothetical protein